MTQMKSFVVVLNFAAPGPLTGGSWVAPDEVSAVALATVSIMQQNKVEEKLQGVLVVEETAEMLRARLHAIEGKPPGEVVSLVQPEPRELRVCRHFPNYPNCSCDSVSCVMLRSTANPAGLESLGWWGKSEAAHDASDTDPAA